MKIIKKNFFKVYLDTFSIQYGLKGKILLEIWKSNSYKKRRVRGGGGSKNGASYFEDGRWLDDVKQ
jgi:hypothetical protein